jgi:AhpD family alkylhydroperoxidase
MDWKAELAATNKNLDSFRAANPDAGKGFSTLYVNTMKPAALGVKEKELIAIAIGIYSHCIDCIGFHVKGGIKAGMTRDELAETVGVTMMMGGGPAFMYGAKAIEAFDQLSG